MSLSTLLAETRTFPPRADFVAQANVNDPNVYIDALQNPIEFWSGWAQKLDWFRPWDVVLDWQLPNAKWFVGGQINACHNCVDRHVANGLGTKTAFIWEGEPGDTQTLTYAEVQTEVSRIANALKALGITKGDRVCLYMPMTPELPMTMLACARIGAAHSVVFGGFSADSLHERINDAAAKVVVTADGGWRRGGIVALKKIVDHALEMGCPSIEKVLVLERAGTPGTVTNGLQTPAYDRGGWTDGRDVWWHDLVPAQSAECACEPMDSEDQSRWIAKTSSSFSTRAARPESRRASSIPPAAISPEHTPPPNGSSTSRTTMSSGARPTAVGSLATATSSMARWRMPPPSSSTRAHPTPLKKTASGESSNATASRSSTPHRPRFAPS